MALPIQPHCSDEGRPTPPKPQLPDGIGLTLEQVREQLAVQHQAVVAKDDTIIVLHDGKEEKIRLYGIDCPEKDQDFGQKAQSLTSALVAGRNVEVQQKEIDRYGRIVGLVLVDGQSLNELIIQNGYA